MEMRVIDYMGNYMGRTLKALQEVAERHITDRHAWRELVESLRAYVPMGG